MNDEHPTGLYTGNKNRPTEEELAAQMAKAGWAIQFEDWNKHYPARATKLEDAVIAGWPVPTPERAGELEEVLSKGTERKIKKLYNENVFGNCELVCLAFVELPEEEILAEIEDQNSAEVVAAIRDASCFYYTRTSAGRNKLSVELQEAIVRALGSLLGGVFEDPQLGECEIITRQ